MTGSGTLVVSSAGGVELALPDVPQVVAVQRALHRLTDDPDRDPWQGADGAAAVGRQDGTEADPPDGPERSDGPDAYDDDTYEEDLPLPQPPRGRGPRAWFGGRR
jgi:hypothetical protein